VGKKITGVSTAMTRPSNSGGVLQEEKKNGEIPVGENRNHIRRVAATEKGQGRKKIPPGFRRKQSSGPIVVRGKQILTKHRRERKKQGAREGGPLR